METRAKSKAEAKERGEKYYFTGKPCPKGHIVDRNIHGQCSQCCKEASKANQTKYKDRYIDTIKLYREKSKEKLAAAKKIYREKNREAISKFNKEYHKNNPHLSRSYKATRRAREKRGKGFTQKQINDMLIAQDCKCVYCAGDVSEVFHIDHIMPLYLGGLNDIDNIQILCPKCNREKYTKHPDEYEKQIGYIRRLKYA